MRRMVFASSFSREADDIAAYIDEQFGGKSKRRIHHQSHAICALIASVPGVGETDHDYATDLVGFPFKSNWIFYEADHHKVRFIHIVLSRRKTELPFDFERT
jgi:plasmid stabilization system protein ParE